MRLGQFDKLQRDLFGNIVALADPNNGIWYSFTPAEHAKLTDHDKDLVAFYFAQVPFYQYA